MTDVADPESERGDEHQVTALELFFDLVFVFAITQVTSFLAHDPTWGGVLQGCSFSPRSGGRGPHSHR
jgi:low temperature requirement protein LtrA